MSGQHCKNYDVKQETVHCYPWNVVRCCTSFVNNVIFVFHQFDAFALLYNKSLNDWSLGEQWILFPSNLNVSRDEVTSLLKAVPETLLHLILYAKQKKMQFRAQYSVIHE